MEDIEIFTPLDSISIVKENKTIVNYFLFNEFEIHLNKIPPNSIQEWHMHKVIEEIIVVTKGNICFEWRSNNETNYRILKKDYLVRVKNSIHTIKNNSNDWAEFIVFRMVPSGNTQSEIIKNDKLIIDFK